MSEEQLLYQIGQAVRKYRITAGLTQEALGLQIVCDKNTIGKIERGEANSRLMTLIRISCGLDIPLSRIMKDSEKQIEDAFAAAIEYDTLRLFQYTRHLTPAQFNLILNTAHLFVKANDMPDGLL